MTSISAITRAAALGVVALSATGKSVESKIMPWKDRLHALVSAKYSLACTFRKEY